jgi:hypothetical protein
MFDLFEGETGVIDDYDDDNDWLDACLGPLPPGTDGFEVIDLRVMLQAEQVAKMLRDMRVWIEGDGIQWYANPVRRRRPHAMVDPACASLGAIPPHSVVSLFTARKLWWRCGGYIDGDGGIKVILKM